MEDLSGWFWPIAFGLGLGKFIDFLIGRVGQKRAREVLETWWYKFDDVRYNNFGRKEAVFAVNFFDRWGGRRFFSLHRWKSIIIFFAISIILGHVFAILQSERGLNLPITIGQFQYISMPLLVIGLAASLSITRLIAAVVARLCNDGVIRNLMIYTIFLTVTYLIIAIWLPVMHVFITLVYVILFSTQINFHELINDTIMKSDFYLVSPRSIVNEFLDSITIHITYPKIVYERMLEVYYLDFAQACAGYVANVVRLIIAIVFLGSFIVRPILMKPISLIWRRIVESDRSLFALILGGTSALITFVSQLLKHLS